MSNSPLNIEGLLFCHIQMSYDWSLKKDKERKPAESLNFIFTLFFYLFVSFEIFNISAKCQSNLLEEFRFQFRRRNICRNCHAISLPIGLQSLRRPLYVLYVQYKLTEIIAHELPFHRFHYRFSCTALQRLLLINKVVNWQYRKLLNVWNNKYVTCGWRFVTMRSSQCSQVPEIYIFPELETFKETSCCCCQFCFVFVLFPLFSDTVWQ